MARVLRVCSSDFPVVTNLASTALPIRRRPPSAVDGRRRTCPPWFSLSTPLIPWQQRRRRFVLEPSSDRPAQEVVHRLALLHARGNHRPDALAPTAAAFATRSLSNVPINHHETDGLFGQVVGRLHSRCCDEGEVGRAMLAETSGHVLARPRCWRLVHAHAQYFLACQQHARIEDKRRQFPPLVKHRKQFFQCLPQALPIAPIACIRQRRQKLDVADQMAPNRIAGKPSIPSCSADTPRNSRSPVRQQTRRRACPSALRRCGGHQCDTTCTTRPGNTRSTSVCRCPCAQSR